MNEPVPGPLAGAGGGGPAWTALLDAMADAAWVADVGSGRLLAANAQAAALLGVAPEALLATPAASVLPTLEDMAWWDEAARGSATPLHGELELPLPGGRALQVMRSIRLLGGQHGHALVQLRDRSAEHGAEARREQVLAQLQATLEATADGILVTDLAGRILACNRRFAALWALPQELLDGSQDAAVHDWLRRSVVDPAAYQQRLQALQDATLASTAERLELVSGQVVERVTRPLVSRGRTVGRVWCFRDLTEQLAAASRIETLSATDALTGLPNRREFAARVAAAASQERRHGTPFAVMLVDLDRFRQVNDTLGLAAGDGVLREVARRLQAVLRQGDVVSRTGGDAFALLLHQAEAPAAEAAARRVLAAVAEPCDVGGSPFTLTCSIGVALSPAHGRSADELTRHAEAAMRAVKAAGRAHHRLYQGRAAGDLRADMKLDHAMRQALAANRFRLHYQPQVELASGRVVGAEALLRWRDPELGEVSPGRFIPVAEDSGFIVAIGDWVLTHAVRQAALWQRRGMAMPVAVNVSALQFQQSHFVERVARVLAASGLPPALLELELTESILLRDADEALARLQALAALGVQLSIDDFGTGYSSLAYLKRFPLDKLKIDRSFVRGLPDDDGDAGIVRAILQLARAMKLSVIAEGVETEPQRQFLLEAGCTEFQGFLFAPALDNLSFERRFGAAQGRGAPQMRLVRSA